MKKVSERAPLG